MTAAAYSSGTPATASTGSAIRYPRSAAVRQAPRRASFTDTPAGTIVRTPRLRRIESSSVPVNGVSP